MNLTCKTQRERGGWRQEEQTEGGGVSRWFMIRDAFSHRVLVSTGSRIIYYGTRVTNM